MNKVICHGKFDSMNGTGRLQYISLVHTCGASTWLAGLVEGDSPLKLTLHQVGDLYCFPKWLELLLYPK